MAEPQEPSRLNKYLALKLGISRREADELIERGQVKVDGQPAIFGMQAGDSNTVEVQGKVINNTATPLQYIIVNKPIGYVCSRSRQGDSPTIYELLPPKYQSLKTAGRLDRDSSGLVLLTNDGDFSFAMTHPKFYKVKVYGIHLDRPLEPLHQQMISDHGITLEDGPSKFELEKVLENRRDMWRIHMQEGRNRQIRRTFSALGYTITALHRTHFGPYTLGTIQPGQFAITQKM